MRRFFIVTRASAAAVVFLFFGCNESPPATQTQISRPELRYPFTGFGSATNGGRLADVVAEFGDPVSSRTLGGTNYLDFFIDPSPQLPKGLIGVTLREKDGVISNVRPITGDPVPSTKAQRAAAKNFIPRDLLFKIGDVAVNIHPKELLPSGLNQQSKNLLVTRALVGLPDGDARAVQLLASTNVGKSVRLYLEDEIISEFQIRDLIRTNEIEIEFNEPGIPLEKFYRRKPVEETTAVVTK